MTWKIITQWEGMDPEVHEDVPGANMEEGLMNAGPQLGLYELDEGKITITISGEGD